MKGVEQVDRARSGRALITMIKDGQRHHFDRPERHGHAGRRLRALDQARTWCGWCVPKVQKHVQPHRIRTSLVYVQRLSALFHTLSGIPVILWRWRTEMHAESRVRMGWVATLIYLLPYPSLRLCTVGHTSFIIPFLWLCQGPSWPRHMRPHKGSACKTKKVKARNILQSINQSNWDVVGCFHAYVSSSDFTGTRGSGTGWVSERGPYKICVLRNTGGRGSTRLEA